MSLSMRYSSSEDVNLRKDTLLQEVSRESHHMQKGTEY